VCEVYWRINLIRRRKAMFVRHYELIWETKPTTPRITTIAIFAKASKKSLCYSTQIFPSERGQPGSKRLQRGQKQNILLGGGTRWKRKTGELNRIHSRPSAMMAITRICWYCIASIVLSSAERSDAKLISTSASACRCIASFMFLYTGMKISLCPQ